MEIVMLNAQDDKQMFYKWATALSLITIFYNIIEGLVSVYFGFEYHHKIVGAQPIEVFTDLFKKIGG